jgi:hypothetical protein
LVSPVKNNSFAARTGSYRGIRSSRTCTVLRAPSVTMTLWADDARRASRFTL